MELNPYSTCVSVESQVVKQLTFPDSEVCNLTEGRKAKTSGERYFSLTLNKTFSDVNKLCFLHILNLF